MKTTTHRNIKREPFTHEVRTKVTKSLGRKLLAEAAREGLKTTDIVRRALVERYQGH